MNTIQQTITIPADRRLRLDIELPDTIPAGQAEMLVVLSPTRPVTSKSSLLRFAGCLADSKTFAGDPVAVQKALMRPSQDIKPISYVKANSAQMLEQVNTSGPMVITQNGEAAAVLMGVLDEIRR